MDDLRLSFEWLDPAGARGEELRATWARFVLEIDAQFVTRVFDQDSQTVRNAVYLPLYPLAEWIATHWWSLLYEVPRDDGDGAAAFLRRHSLIFAREGFALPDLKFEPRRTSVEITWRQTSLGAHRVEFLSEGSTHVSTESLREKLGSFVGSVVKRLEERGVGETLLQQEWHAIQHADPEERAFCEAAGTVGLDPYDLDDEQAAAIKEAAKQLPCDILLDFLEAVDISEIGEAQRTLLDALDKSRQNTADLRSLASLAESVRKSVAGNTGPPWQAGYAAARAVRRKLGLDGEPMDSMDKMATALKVEPDVLESGLVSLNGHARSFFDGVVTQNQKKSPSFALTSRGTDGRRLHFCRGLFEYLAQPESRPVLLTSVQDDIQARNRAFAAEFLAPSEGLRQRLPTIRVMAEDVDELAETFGVSPLVIRHQLENHRIARVIE